MTGIFVEAARPRVIRESPRAGGLAVATVCFGAFMGQLDASIVTLTFPALQQDFHAPLAAVQWVSLCYLLALVGLVAAAGRIADAAGRKLIYLYGFIVFTAASAACGFAPGLDWLVVFRVLQAAGAAMLQANSVALIVTSVRREQIRSALGVQAAAQALGLALGPTIGGLLVASVGWRWVFWVNVPIGCIAVLAGHYLLPRTRERTPAGRFDLAGLALLVAFTTTLLLGLSAISGLDVPTWTAGVLAAICVLCGWGFVRREARTQNPLLDLSLIRPTRVWAGLAGALCAYLVLFGPLALFPQILGDGTSVRVGLVLTALPAGFAGSALVAERLLPLRWDARTRALFGAGAAAVAAAALIIAPTSTPWVAAWLFVLGIGLGVFIPANNAAVMSAVPARSSAVGGGLVNMGRGLGTALGVAVVTLCLHIGAASGAEITLGVLAVCAVAAGVTGLSARALE